MWGFMGGMRGALPDRFEEQYHCYSAAMADKTHLEVRARGKHARGAFHITLNSHTISWISNNFFPHISHHFISACV